MRRREFIRTAGLAAAAMAAPQWTQPLWGKPPGQGNQADELLDRAVKILMKWKCEGGPLDLTVIYAIGRSGKPEALEWLKNPKLPSSCAANEEYIDAMGTARGWLDSDWFGHEMESADPERDLPGWVTSVPPTPRNVKLLRERAGRGETFCMFRLLEISPEYREYVIRALARNETWPVLSFWPGFLYTLPIDQVMSILGPVFAELDPSIQNEIILAYFAWPPNPWDAEFAGLITEARSPEEALYFVSTSERCHYPYRLDMHPSAPRPEAAITPDCRYARLLLDMYLHSRTTIGAIMAAEKLLPHGEAGAYPIAFVLADERFRWEPPTSDLFGRADIRKKLDLALADPHPERWANGASDAAARVGRWLIGQGEVFEPEPFIRLARSAPPQDRVEAMFTLGYVLEFNDISPVVRKVRRDHGHDGWDWWLMGRLAEAAANPDLLRGLSYERLRGGGINALWWNQAVGIKPDLADWMERASRGDRLSLGQQVFSFRPHLVSPQILGLFGGWKSSADEPERTWGQILDGPWGGEEDADELARCLDSCPDPSAREAALTWLLEVGVGRAAHVAAALQHFLKRPTEACGQIIFERLGADVAAGYGRSLMEVPDPLVSTVGAALYVRSQPHPPDRV